MSQVRYDCLDFRESQINNVRPPPFPTATASVSDHRRAASFFCGLSLPHFFLHVSFHVAMRVSGGSCMRLLSVRLIVSLIIGITLVSLGFSYYAVLREKRGLRGELQRRAEVLGESVAGNVEKAWETGSDRDLQKVVQRFGNREHLLGVAVYNRQGNAVAMSSGLDSLLKSAPREVTQAMALGQEESSFQRLGKDPVQIFAVP